jgi:hypothetical protein
MIALKLTRERWSSIAVTVHVSRACATKSGNPRTGS